MASGKAIQNLAKQALETFRSIKGDRTTFLDKLGGLRSTMNPIRAADLGIDPDARNLTTGQTSSAPVGYIFIAENCTVSMSVFLVERDCRLPLHDHHEMHGLIKVLFGKIRMQSYDILNEDQLQVVSPKCDRSIMGRNFFPVRKREEVRLTENSEPCLLTPSEANIHSIEAVDGPAAFLDILSPPYNSEFGRDCLYYKETKMADSSKSAGEIRWLQRIAQPASFWCCQEPYLGPAVNLDEV